MRAYELHAEIATAMREGEGSGFGGKVIQILTPSLGETFDIKRVEYDPVAETYFVIVDGP